MNTGFKVEWTGSWPSLCHGEWKIKYNGKPLNLPNDVVDSPMDTYLEYKEWYFGYWGEEWEDRSDGLDCDAWVEKYKSKWIDKVFDEAGIEKTNENYCELFYKIQSQDFRSCSCGGCI